MYICPTLTETLLGPIFLIQQDLQNVKKSNNSKSQPESYNTKLKPFNVKVVVAVVDDVFKLLTVLCAVPHVEIVSKFNGS